MHTILYVFHEENKSFTLLSASPTFLRVIFLVTALSVVQTYVFYSLLKHQLTIDNSFALIRSCRNEVYKVESRKKILENHEIYAVANFRWPKKNFYWPKIIEITIAESIFIVFLTWSVTAVRANAIFFERMVVEQWPEFDMKHDLKWFSFSQSS